jgi:hypothetical protein
MDNRLSWSICTNAVTPGLMPAKLCGPPSPSNCPCASHIVQNMHCQVKQLLSKTPVLSATISFFSNSYVDTTIAPAGAARALRGSTPAQKPCMPLRFHSLCAVSQSPSLLCAICCCVFITSKGVVTAAATTPAQLAATTFALTMLEGVACCSEEPNARRVGSMMDQKMAVNGTSLKSCTHTLTLKLSFCSRQSQIHPIGAGEVIYMTWITYGLPEARCVLYCMQGAHRQPNHLFRHPFTRTKYIKPAFHANRLNKQNGHSSVMSTTRVQALSNTSFFLIAA